MTKAQKAIGAGLLATMAAVLVSAASGPAAFSPVTPVYTAPIPAAVTEAIQTAAATGEATVELELTTQTAAAVSALKAEIMQSGGEVLRAEGTQVLARLPAAAAESIHQSQAVVAVGINQQLELEQAQVATLNEAIAAAEATGLIGPNMDAIGATSFRAIRGVTGSGVTVALIDTGIDPGHPALQRTPLGQPKLIDWKDFTREGYVQTTASVTWGATFQAPDGRVYRLPPRPAASREARFGYWEEFSLRGVINRDLDRNGSQTDAFGVLLVDSRTPGQYDTVYVDTNNNRDFTDEEPLRLFSQSQSVGHMGRIRVEPAASRRLNFAVADLDAEGRWVSFGFDGMGHGTQVAGVLAASGDGFSGVAPGVQLMALKAIGSAGSGDWFAIKQAIQYAASHGAQIINLSIGGLASAATQFDAGASEWLNQISRQYGCLIILAADNTGPGLSSGTTLGNPSEVMAIGAYYSPEMWKRDFGATVPHESIWSLSGMGPRSDGSYLPNVVAPGGSPTTSPQWLDASGYTTKVGTSIATPHVSGAAALLIEAGRKAGINSDRMSIKRALEMGARRVAGFDVYEQGNGLIDLTGAYTNLTMINSVPAFTARAKGGDGGLLARSYAPGSTSFWLTNLGTDLSRVGVFSSQDWVRPMLSLLTLPPAVPRELPLEMTPPTEPGVHSAFLMLTQQDKYGASLTIPITYVKPIDLGQLLDGKYATANQLEVGRYRRYFFNVKPGTGSFSVTARVPLAALATQGTVQVHVFRPDGKAIYHGDMGKEGRGLSASTTADYPVEGVWEVVVYAAPDMSGGATSAEYTLDVQARPGNVPNVPLKFNVAAGSTTTWPITLVNPGDPFVGYVQAVGLTRYNGSDLWNQGIPWRVEQKSQSTVEEFNLKEHTSYMRIEVSHPIPADTSVNLALYYLDKQGGWQLRGQALAQPSGHEVLEVRNLPPGRYQTMIVVNGSAPQPVQYQYRRLMGVEGFMVFMDDTARLHDRGNVWTPRLTIKAPNAPGRYTGQLLLWDTVKQTTIGWYPFEVSVGQPALSVQPMVPQLVQGRPSTVVFELRDADSGVLTDGTITVNGQRFVSRGGRVSVPVTPEGASLTLEVEANLPQYQYVKQRFVLPVRENWGFHPIGADTEGENADLHRKLSSELP